MLLLGFAGRTTDQPGLGQKEKKESRPVHIHVLWTGGTWRGLALRTGSL